MAINEANDVNADILKRTSFCSNTSFVVSIKTPLIISGTINQTKAIDTTIIRLNLAAESGKPSLFNLANLSGKYPSIDNGCKVVPPYKAFCIYE
jgi:hypothetical protein